MIDPNGGVVPVCAACENCLRHEEGLQSALKKEVDRAISVRAKRGSRFRNKDAVFSMGGLIHRSESRIDDRDDSRLSPDRAFAILAPSISFKSKLKDILTSSAAKLYFVLLSARRTLDSRLKSDQDDKKWYLKPKEFEKLMLVSGTDWMTGEHMLTVYNLLDLNKSGFLHLAELCAVFQHAFEVCRDILNGGTIDPSEFRSNLLEFRDLFLENSLVCQIRNLNS